MRFRAKRTIIVLTVVVFIIVHLVIYMTQRYSDSQSSDESLFEMEPLDIHFNRPPARVNSENVVEILTKETDALTNNTKVFSSVAEAHSYMGTHVRHIGDSPRILIQYSNFTRSAPKFISKEDYEMFMRSDRNLDNLLPNDYSQLRGVIEIIPNATFKMDYDCGYRSSSDYLRVPREAVKSFNVLVPLVIPMGFLFQHFFDGTFPKIVQAYPFIKQQGVKLLMERPHHDNVYSILEKLNITSDRVVWHLRDDTTTVYHAKFMIFTCITPPIHPELWHTMRNILRVSNSLVTEPSQAYVVYLTRAGAVIGGRTAVNEKEVIRYLQARFGAKLIVFDGTYNLAQALQVFSQATILIGTHGGAFYNLNYCPQSTVIIEFVPVFANGEDIRSLPHAIFWAMSHILGMEYWRVPCFSVNRLHDMEINIEKLEKILERLEP